MFTGIVEGTAELVSRDESDGTILTLAASKIFDELQVGDSVAVNGVCLTVTRVGPELATFAVVPETLSRTNLGNYQPGARLNIERPMKADGRFDGHIVQGHVDGTGELVSRESDGESDRLRFAIDAALDRYIVVKGSVTVDGVSLTVTECSPGQFEVAVIPHTLVVTRLGEMPIGDSANIEVDVIAKYIEKHVEKLLGDAS